MEVTLKNGSREFAPLVGVAMGSLGLLMQKNPIAFYELVMKARDRQHIFFGNTAEVLRGYALIEADGDLHETLRNVVLSAVRGDGLNMVLSSPIAG